MLVRYHIAVKKNGNGTTINAMHIINIGHDLSSSDPSASNRYEAESSA
jgi:hypothetical protein